MINRKISIAPMMECTDRHYRYFMRLISQHTLLYTEMIHMNQIIYGDPNRFLQFHSTEHPLAIQLGGSDPISLAKASKIAEQYGYQEINLNVGCPSNRVQAGRFGACLMKDPQLVADCFIAIQEAVNIPVTVKTRVGVDDLDSYDLLCNFTNSIAATGCKTFIIHARKAWLKGLSPKQNRSVPPLQYDKVHRLKQDFSELEIIINGGIKTLMDIDEHLKQVDGVMIGREAYHNPYLFAEIDQQFFNSTEEVKSRMQVIEAYAPYVKDEIAKGTRLNLLTRPILGLFNGLPKAKLWREFITVKSRAKAMDFSLLEKSMAVF